MPSLYPRTMHGVPPLFLSNALLADGTTCGVRIVDGVVVAHGGTPAAGDVVHDLGGDLLLPAMAEAHAHLDKAYLSELVPNPSGDLMGAIDGIMRHAHLITVDGTADRAERAARTIARHGATHIRTHVDVRHDNGLAALQGVVEARRRVSDVVDIEIVALSDWPICGAEGADQRSRLRDALAAGADLVGGCPHLDPSPESALEEFLAIAADCGVPVDLHTDEHTDPDRSTLALLAERVRATGFSESVTASHCVSLSMMPVAAQQRIAAMLAEADVNVVALPSSNLYLQGREHPHAVPRAIAPVSVLRSGGVNVAAGWDNLQDPFNPMGRGDCLETAALMVMAAHQLPDDAFSAVSNCVRRAMRLRPAGTSPGDAADLVALPARTIRQAIAEAPTRRTVIRAGVLVPPTGP
ncbi:MAG: putative cytosine deaminase [Actinomycetota bacterium]